MRVVKILTTRDSCLYCKGITLVIAYRKTGFIELAGYVGIFNSHLGVFSGDALA